MSKQKKSMWKSLSKRLKTSFKTKSGKSKRKKSEDNNLQRQEKVIRMPVDNMETLVTMMKNNEALDGTDLGFKIGSKHLDTDMGFGYISDNCGGVDCRVVLQGPNPFIDNYYGTINPDLGGNMPYSQIYNVNNSGTGYLMMRHYLHLPKMTPKEKESIMIAFCESNEPFDGHQNLTSKTVSYTSVSRTLSNQSSSNKLLGQMEKLVHHNNGSGMTSGNEGDVGAVIVTVHKAVDIEKKGLVGKADPYVLIKYNEQELKSKIVDNNHNPVWNFTANVNINREDNEENIKIQIFDDDIGKDDFLGECMIDTKSLINGNNFANKTFELEKCKSGKIVISAKFVPINLILKKIGELSLIVHSATKLDKKNKLKKADPYIVCTVGSQSDKSATIKNTSNPQWEHKVNFDILEFSPDVMSIEVFDDDIGKDPMIGNALIDLKDIMMNNKVEQKVSLENCKGGELLISAFFIRSENIEEMPQQTVEHKTTVQVNQTSPSPKVSFMKPLVVDEEYIVVEANPTQSWFMVVSPDKDLPTKFNLVPFKKYTEDQSRIYLKCLPAGGFHHVKRVVHSGHQLRKCGYELPCVLNNGHSYNILVTDKKGRDNLGEVVPSTWGPDTMNMTTEIDKHQDYVDISVMSNTEEVFRGTVSLYENLSEPVAA